MKNPHIVAGLVVLVVLGIGYFVYTQTAQAPTGEPATQAKLSYINSSADMIVVLSPEIEEQVEQEFAVLGKARGTWYFEASFPVVVTDPNGVVLAQLPATADGDWMTTEFVPFSATVVIQSGYTGPATITLKKDNPSGLPEHDASVSFPVVIQ